MTSSKASQGSKEIQMTRILSLSYFILQSRLLQRHLPLKSIYCELCVGVNSAVTWLIVFLLISLYKSGYMKSVFGLPHDSISWLYQAI